MANSFFVTGCSKKLRLSLRRTLVRFELIAANAVVIAQSFTTCMME